MWREGAQTKPALWVVSVWAYSLHGWIAAEPQNRILQWLESVQLCLLSASTPVDSQENTAILLQVLPNGNESLGVRPRQGVGVRMRRSGEDGGNSSWRHPNGSGEGRVPISESKHVRAGKSP